MEVEKARMNTRENMLISEKERKNISAHSLLYAFTTTASKQIRFAQTFPITSLVLTSRKMFSIVTETWNPVTGCRHDCIYCWARRLALGRLRKSERYRNGFEPRLNVKEFEKRFSGGVVFVSDMGDLFGEWVPPEWIRAVIDYVSRFPSTLFLFMTKNPARYLEFTDEFPRNVILGATIETNRDLLAARVSKAPPPSARAEAMAEARRMRPDLHYLVSVEPVMDFDVDVIVDWIRAIAPTVVYVGYDNYNNRLPEPPLAKVEELIRRLTGFTMVVRKTIRPAWWEET